MDDGGGAMISWEALSLIKDLGNTEADIQTHTNTAWCHPDATCWEKKHFHSVKIQIKVHVQQELTQAHKQTKPSEWFTSLFSFMQPVFHTSTGSLMEIQLYKKLFFFFKFTVLKRKLQNNSSKCKQWFPLTVEKHTRSRTHMLNETWHFFLCIVKLCLVHNLKGRLFIFRYSPLHPQYINFKTFF